MSRAKRAAYFHLVILAIILIAGAAVRFHFSDANSYWLDEFLSVYTYGIQNESALEAVRRLAQSIHPPLYQLLLYYWMAVFGDGETATRSLSNLFIIGATLNLYLSVRKVYDAWLGIAVAFIFTLMFTPTYLGMETRSYAQTIFLSSLSTLLLIHALPCIAEKSWRQMMADRWILALLVTNTALILTHYYNVLFLGAQGLFLFVYVMWRSGEPLGALAKSVAVGSVPALVLLSIWGPVMLHSYNRFADYYFVGDWPMNPLVMFREMILHWNFTNIASVYAVWGLTAALAVLTLIRLIRRPDDESFLTLWFLLAATLPVLLAFALFLVSGHERYSSRYFCFSVGPLAVVLVLSVYRIVQMFGHVGPLPRWSAFAVTFVVAVALVAPGGLYALKRTKHDWRGIAEAIVDRVRKEPDKRFVIFSTKSAEMLDYYLARYSEEARVYKTLPYEIEWNPKLREIEVPDADFAIVAFAHRKAKRFPRMIEALEGSMNLVEKNLTHGRGYLLFSIPSS